jgi:cobalamin biosynthesis protein CobT
MKKNPLINLHAWTKSARAIAGKHGLSVRFKPGGDTVKIEGLSVEIPVPDDRWTDKDFDNVLFAVDQYGSMWRYGDHAFKEYEELPPDKPIGWMLREFEQHRTMREASDEFKGSQEIMGVGVSNRLEDHVIPKMEGMDPKTAAIMEAGAEASAHWNKGYATGVGGMMPHVLKNDDGRAILEKLDDMDFNAALNGTESVADSLALAKRTFQQVWEEDPDEEEKNEREGESEGGDGEPEGGGTPLEGTNPNSGTDATAGEGKGKGKGKEAPVKGEKEVGEDSSEDDIDNTTGSGSYTITNPKGGSFTLENPERVKYYDFKKDPNGKPNSGNIANWMAHCGYTENANAAVFANRLRRMILVASQGFYTHGHRRGKLSTKNLYKLCVEHDMPGTDRMFKQKHQSDILDTCVEVLVDYSGSMCGDETVLTYEGTRLLTHAMQVLNVPCEINMFSTVLGGTHVMTVKHFDERINDDKLLDRCERAAHNMSGNNDSAAVLMCYDRVKRRPEKRKIYLVLSDGQPACGPACRNPGEALKHVVKGIQDEGIVEIMGLGVGPYSAVDYYYAQHVTVTNLEGMPTALIDLVGNKMLNTEGGS